jgi:cyclic beta-1,2-glucan synthetase
MSGIDPYAAAASDVYQDLFGEGSYTGKGIYDVDAFTDALEGRVPENTLLSHDLVRGHLRPRRPRFRHRGARGVSVAL